MQGSSQQLKSTKSFACKCSDVIAELINMFDSSEAALGLLSVTLFSGADFQMKGGRGRIRAWATRESALLRVMGAYMLRLNLRTNAARHPKVVVLKQIISLKQAASGIPVEQAALAEAVEDSNPLMLEFLPEDSQEVREDEALEEEDEWEARENAAAEVPTDPASEDLNPTTATGSIPPATGSIPTDAACMEQEPSLATASIPMDTARKDQESTTATASLPTHAAREDQETTTATASIPTDAAREDQESTAATGAATASLPTDAAREDQESTTAVAPHMQTHEA